MMANLPAMPVAGTLLVAALLLVFGKKLPPRTPDIVAIATALAVIAICAAMTARAATQPLLYWYGGWSTQGLQVIGIRFVVDEAGGSIATLVGVLFAASLVFSWGFFAETHAHFHVLMLLFMAGMVGFCLTHDLFNMFVWFELMSVSGFALTGYQLRASALQGAMNFTVINTIGSYLLLSGIALIYAEVNALDFSALASGAATRAEDPVVWASFALLASGFLIKAAQAPFHFWLADAHTVAPSPVSVIFSGAMVAIGLFGVGRLIFAVYAAVAPVQHVVASLLESMGVASTLVGACMALTQRHLKRMLAFSTISHVGIMLIGLGLLSRGGVSGLLIYFVGHGLVKGTLFMISGILLATCGGIDEIGLRGLGRAVWPAGVAMALGGLLLAGLPVGVMSRGVELVADTARQQGHRALPFVLIAGGVGTGAAVLRAAGRIFLGWGPVAGEEESAPTEQERENANRPLWLMLAPAAVLLALVLPLGRWAEEVGWHAAAWFIQPDAASLAEAQAAAPAAGVPWHGWISVALAMALAAAQLLRHRAPGWVAAGIGFVTRPVTATLDVLHSGLVGDYVTWLVVGLALFTASFALS